MLTAGAVHQAWRALPLADYPTVFGGETCLVLAPHPDDESLGCGGLIALACALGHPPAVAILTDGSGSHPGSVSHPPADLAALRQAEARRAVACLGLPAERLVFLQEVDGQARGCDDVVRRVAAIVQAFGCSTVVAPWRLDPHCDHATAAQIAARLGVRVLSYPVWGWMLPDDQPVDAGTVTGWRLDIRSVLERKQQAIAAHVSQHGQLISDAPDGFRLPDALMARLTQPWEVMLAT